MHDIVVLSDLHLGEGLSPHTQRFSPTEDFFLDKPFARFLAHLEDRYRVNPEELTLVLAGDVFDFLTVTRVPSEGEAKARALEVSSAEKKFGLDPSEQKSVYKLDVIFAGHREWFRALAHFIGAGHRVEILPGNHDMELFFSEVRSRLLRHLASFEDGPDLHRVTDRVGFHRWFYMEPGRLYIEHGHQYDASNSLRHPLRPLLPERRWWQREQKEELLDYPLGSIFVRFFYNRVKSLDPYTPRFLSFDQYLDFVKRYNLFDVWRIYKDHYPHFVAALGPETPAGRARESESDKAFEEEELRRLVASDEHGGLYELLSELKIHPASANTLAIVKEMVEPVFKRFFWFSIFAFGALSAWLLIFLLIQKVPWIVANAFLLSVFAVLTVGALAWSWINFRRRQQRQDRSASRSYYLERAEQIAEAAKVRLVIMGHTHRVEYRPLKESGAVYLNGGTWTSVHNPWSRIMRDARRKTFTFVQGRGARLARWNDDAERIDEVPLFHLEEDRSWDKREEDLLNLPRPASGEHSWLPSGELVPEEDNTHH